MRFLSSSSSFKLSRRSLIHGDPTVRPRIPRTITPYGRHPRSPQACASRAKSSSTVPSPAQLEPLVLESTSNGVERPTNQQLRRVFVRAAVPMIGFGFMDQTIMLHAGNVIDCTIGVTFGLSTLTAAAIGQVCSDASGVLFGGTLESLFLSLGLPKAGLSALQRSLPLVRRVQLAGSLIGVITGCCLGLVNLVFIDTNRSSTLKLQAFNEEQEFEFQIEASNGLRKGFTALKVTGPDVDGLLASMTAALAVRGCSLVELHAQRSRNEEVASDGTQKQIEDIFYVVNRETGMPFEDEDLEELARGLLDSTRTPMNVNSVKVCYTCSCFADART